MCSVWVAEGNVKPLKAGISWTQRRRLLSTLFSLSFLTPVVPVHTQSLVFKVGTLDLSAFKSENGQSSHKRSSHKWVWFTVLLAGTSLVFEMMNFQRKSPAILLPGAQGGLGGISPGIQPFLTTHTFQFLCRICKKIVSKMSPTVYACYCTRTREV